MSGDWNTIESDAVWTYVMSLCCLTTSLLLQAVFTHLVDKLGVKEVQFDELVEIDADYLRQQRCAK